MPLYIIERTFAEQLDLTDDDVTLIEGINAEEGVRWDDPRFQIAWPEPPRHLSGKDRAWPDFEESRQ